MTSIKFTLKISSSLLALLVLAPAAGLNSPKQTSLLICEDTETIEIANCSLWDTKAQISDDTVTFRLDGPCLGEPDGVKDPVCLESHLLAKSNHLPTPTATVELFWSDGEKDRSVVLVSRDPEGTIHIPSWATTLRVSSNGYEDKALTLADLSQSVYLRTGREVFIVVKQAKESESLEAIDLELDGVNIDLNRSDVLIPDEPRYLGAVPIGHYNIALTGKGIAPYYQQISIDSGDDPLELEFPSTTGVCLLIPIDVSDAPGLSAIDFVLTQLKRNQFASVYLKGSTEMQPTAEPELRQVKLCALAPARYELELRGRGVATEQLTIELKETAITTAPTVVLLSAEQTTLVLIDQARQPVSEASVGIYWSRDAQRHSSFRYPDARGTLALPAFREPTSLRVNISANGFRPTSLEFSSLQDQVVMLEPAGYLIAEIENDACSKCRFNFEIKKPCGYGEKPCWSGMAKYMVDECHVKQSIEQAQEYQVTITSECYVRFQEVIEIGESLSHDLGTIHPDPGYELEVAVTADRDPVPGATVAIEDFAPGKLTDRNGRVTFSCLNEDLQSVVLLASNDLVSVRQEVAIPDNRLVEIDLPHPGAIYGKAMNDGGLPAAGEMLLLSRGGQETRVATIAFNGSYRFDRLQPGEWSLVRNRISTGDGVFRQSTGDTRTVRLNAGDEVEVNFIPEIEIHGRVTLDEEIYPDRSLTAVSFGGPSETIGFRTDGFGNYDTRLTRTGNWLFHDHGATARVEITGPCPCLVDINLMQ